MSDMTLHEAEPLRIIKSLQERYDSASHNQSLRPVYEMAMGMAALKIMELEKEHHSVDAIEVRLDSEIEEMYINKARDVLNKSGNKFPWTKAIAASSIGGFGTLIIAAATFAFLKHLDALGLLASFW